MDLRDAAEGTPVAGWMSLKHPTRCIGYGYSHEDEMNQFTTFDPRSLHDALVYISMSSAPTPLTAIQRQEDGH